MYQPTKPTVNLTMDIEIHDPERFASAARARAIAEGVDPQDAAETYTVEDLAACAVMLIDPGLIGEDGAGASILDTNAERY